MSLFRYEGRVITVVDGEVVKVGAWGSARKELARLPKKLRPEVIALTSGGVHTVAPSTEEESDERTPDPA